MNFRKSFLIGVLCALMVGLPNWVRAAIVNGHCGAVAFHYDIIDTSSACTGGMCVGGWKAYPTVYKCMLVEAGIPCDDDAMWYTTKEIAIKTVENNTWSRWFYCGGVDVACYTCITAAFAAGLLAGAVVGGTAGAPTGPGAAYTAYAGAVAGAAAGTEVACWFVCGNLPWQDLCCWVDCVKDWNRPTYSNYKKGCVR